jgi:hypothetical protein
MEDIQFEEEQQYQPVQKVEQKSLFIRIVLATGIVSDDKQAEYVLLGFFVSCILLAVIIGFFLNTSNSPMPLPTGTLVPGPNGSATFTK